MIVSYVSYLNLSQIFHKTVPDNNPEGQDIIFLWINEHVKVPLCNPFISAMSLNVSVIPFIGSRGSHKDGDTHVTHPANVLEGPLHKCMYIF